MVVLTTVAVGATVATGGAAAPALSGVAMGVVNAGAAGSAATVAATTGAGMAAGGIVGGTAVATGAGATAVAAGTITGAGIGASAAGATASLSTGFSGLVTTGLAAGPVGWFCLGTEQKINGEATYDCWKPILRVESKGLSKGVYLKDILTDRRVQSVRVQNLDSFFPEIILENIWGEKFDIEYVSMPSNEICLHAVRIY